MKLSYTELAKLTAGATGGLVVTNAATSVSTMVTSGPQTTFGRVMRVGTPAAVAAGIVTGLPQNEYTQGAAVGAAMVGVSQALSILTMAFGMSDAAAAGSSGGGSGTEGLGAAETAVLGGGVPASQALSRRKRGSIPASDLVEDGQQSRLEMDK